MQHIVPSVTPRMDCNMKYTPVENLLMLTCMLHKTEDKPRTYLNISMYACLGNQFKSM